MEENIELEALNSQIATLVEIARIENYHYFNRDNSNNTEKFENMVKNYVGKILNYKTTEIKLLEEKVGTIAKRIVEHITGDYEIGLADQTFEEMNLQAENIANIIGYSEFT